MLKSSITFHYRPQTKFAKVIFLQVSVCPQGGVHGPWVGGGMCGTWQGCAWQGGACVAGGMCGGGVCMVGGMHGREGHAWWHGCMVGGEHVCHSRYYEIWSMRGRYASYWNAFLLLCLILDFLWFLQVKIEGEVVWRLLTFNRIHLSLPFVLSQSWMKLHVTGR